MPTYPFDIGFLGGGQLARMSIQAAQRMGLKCMSMDPMDETPASLIAPAGVGSLQDPYSISEIFGACEFITLENEFIPGEAIREGARLAGRSLDALIPNIDALETIQDKLRQRETLVAAGVPSPKAVSLADGGETAIEEIGFPMVLKARFGGYDGKGTRYARTREEMELHRVLWEGNDWMAEEFVPFKRELAVMVYTSAMGAGSFPTMETVQHDHVCNLVFPSGVDASDIAISAVQAVEGVGLFGVELFELEDGTFQVNELAPRPHNTGHYTLDWGGTSQFEQHIRLVMGMMVGEPKGLDVCMVNLLGQPAVYDHRNGLRDALIDPAVHAHWYEKTESRPGRKMGHLNVISEGQSTEELVKQALAAQTRFYTGWERPVETESYL